MAHPKESIIVSFFFGVALNLPDIINHWIQFFTHTHTHLDVLATAVNVPLRSGVDDELFISLFKELVPTIFGQYQPMAVVLQW